MAIPVRIEAKAWTDPRYQTLAIELGMARARHALIAVADIWRWQTEHYSDERPTYCVPRAVIVGALEHRGGPEAMVAAGLAEAQPDGTFRICGGRNDKGESRIDWYWRGQSQRSAAGSASADRRKKAGDPRAAGGRLAPLTDGGPTGDQRATNEPPTEAQRDTERPPSSLVSDLQSQDQKTHTPRARDLVVELAERLHQTHAVEARKLADSIPGCASVRVGGGPLAGETQELVRATVGRWLMEAAALDVEREPFIVEQMARLVAVRAAKARAASHVRWWAPSTFWDPAGIERDLAQTPKQAADGSRDGPRRPSHQPAPPARTRPLRDL